MAGQLALDETLYVIQMVDPAINQLRGAESGSNRRMTKVSHISVHQAMEQYFVGGDSVLQSDRFLIF
jgi:hypothetical protein